MIRPEKQEQDRRVMVYAGVILFTMLGVFVAALVLDTLYEPYEFIDYTATPDQACSGEDVTVEVERRIDPRVGFTVRQIEAQEVLWIDSKTEQPVPVPPPSPQPISPSENSGTETVESVIVTITPARPGTYTLYTELKVSGRAFVFGADQMLDVQTDDVLRVLPGDNEKCQGE